MTAPQVTEFGRLPDGTPVRNIRLTGGGLRADLLDYGARLRDLRLAGQDAPLVLGADEVTPYLDAMNYFGAIVGRCANRIGGAGFDLGGTRHATQANEPGVTLHGGAGGASARIWEVTALRADRVRFAWLSPAGEMGFPGTLRAEAEIALEPDATLAVTLRARTDAATPCNFAHHSYFQLGGPDPVRDPVPEHRLWIDAPRYLPVDGRGIPVAAAPAAVAGTRFDFTAPEGRALGRAGIDHNFCLSDAPAGSDGMRRVARVTSATRVLEVETDQPGLQVYDGHGLPEMTGLGGRRYGAFAGLALETQGWPDAVNRGDFPPVILRPGDTYLHRVRYRIAAV
ncbi:hypothetical protein CBW24_15560 (plasmid) [Pacificitalea manganoxidans]|uniref:Aldose 1-epimerase n=1 Tax=Pacificitalea manganoxidans TaxID=1411902 RepID=A0A291M3M5_9RHOB|nr:aldose epimerase family protein [Pacificitalea manganoxidans]ATI43566.1 hypothetical protein CBW24_15560 [Pacificitalea manganoxidans]MDR6309998.1 aldose 1-epimerase [Pacificitalea manganoxidans]